MEKLNDGLKVNSTIAYNHPFLYWFKDGRMIHPSQKKHDKVRRPLAIKTVSDIQLKYNNDHQHPCLIMEIVYVE